METGNVSLAHSSLNEDAPELARAFDQSHVFVEAEKGALARTLHDDIGGLLVGAIMDIGWVANQPNLADAVKEKLARAQGLMRTAIDMTREIVEDLKPTLLDNIGLYLTLRWHMKVSCDAACVVYTESFPLSEAGMDPEVRLGVFRIFEEALKEVLLQRTPTGLSVKAEVIGGVLHCHLIHQSESHSDAAAHLRSPETSMHLRAQHMGGNLRWSTTSIGRHMHLQVPLFAPEA
jgi:two-component system, NarL family, sensor histidine kinase UhpB